MKQALQQTHLTARQLKGRGWTDSAIARFLNEPDQLVPNPAYRSAPPMRLYSIDRVEQIEQTCTFQQWLTQSSSRKESARRAVATKLDKMQQWLDSLTIEIPILRRHVLIDYACQHYNERQLSRQCHRGCYDDEWEPASSASDPSFLCRITVNYLRHQLTHYDSYLKTTFGQVGVELAYREISKKIFAAIGQTYDWLKPECDRQLKERFPNVDAPTADNFDIISKI